jgi:hypothetical protein
LLGAVVFFPVEGWAQNTSAATASKLLVGQAFTLVTLDDTTTQRFYQFRAVQGRSYCVEAVGDESSTLQNNDVELTVLRADGVTQIVAANDASGEPGGGQGFGPSRGCYIAPATEQNVVLVFDNHAGTNSWRLRVVETTVFCPWFFIGSDYESFALLRNTTNTTISNVTHTWRNLEGTVLATSSVFVPGGATGVPANGTRAPRAKDFFSSATSPNGSVEIAHDGSPEALVANVSNLSLVTGLSFDVTCGQRRPW